MTTDKEIFFYIINKDTLMPELENVMFNYMGCNQMMFGKRVRYGISYKSNQKCFDVYTRKYMHNLRVNVNSEQLEGSKGLELQGDNLFLITKIDKVLVYDSDTFTQVSEVPIALLKTETREPNEVIGLQKSNNEVYIAVISGKNLVQRQQKQNQLFIFKRQAPGPGERFKAELWKRIVVKDIPEFNKVCMQFYFKEFQNEPQAIIFSKQDYIFEMNIHTSEIKPIFTFNPPLLTQPTLMQMSDDQKIIMVASERDCYYINMKTNNVFDIDEEYRIDCIREIKYDNEDKAFYLLANKQKEKLGFFLIKINEDNPLTDSLYLTLWKNKLDIADANITLLRGTDEENGEPYKELVISYKTIYINTYNVVVVDGTEKTEGSAIIYKHEAFQLWESQIFGLMLQKNKEYISFSKSGMNILALGSKPKRGLKDHEGQSKMIHSLESLTFLKIDPINSITFECQDYNNRIISIDQEYKKFTGNGFENYYENIYKVKIHEITLRELMILQSFYLCKTQSDIFNLVRKQPTPRLFYKTFLELDCANMVSILAFDNGSIKTLLGEHNEEYFNSKYPIIYKNKIPKKAGKKFYFRTAIDNALRNNQVEAVKNLINYVVTYQNNFVSSYLFMKSIPILLEKGIQIHNLLQSNIFYMQFDYDEWPGSHTNRSTEIRPFNGSIFELMHSYSKVFPEKEFQPIDETN